MAQVRAFSGPAGSGKTYALMREVERACSTVAYEPSQSILAITFMHGSRRRLAARLHECATNGVPFQCETIDSFCLRIVNRFRRYLSRHKPVTIQHDHADAAWTEREREWRTGFQQIRNSAIELLRFSTVRSSVGHSYPLIVVDEFQDCEGPMLELVGLLSMTSTVLVSADGFQHLSQSPICPAMHWLRESDAQVVELEGNHRTSESLLHETAAALRERRKAVFCCDVFALDGPGLVAWRISSKLAWGKVPPEATKVLISPVRLESSTWLQGVLASLEKELGQKSILRPRPFRWESGEAEQFTSAVEIINASVGSKANIPKSLLRAFERSDHPIVRMAGAQARRLLSIRGDDGLVNSEFTDIVRRASHSASAFRLDRTTARLAMTVHGAKNREFDYVFIAWPYNVPNDDLYKRKLLYNAVTRAKVEVVLFLQGGERRVRDDAVLNLLEVGVVKKEPKATTRRKTNRK